MYTSEKFLTKITENAARIFTTPLSHFKTILSQHIISKKVFSKKLSKAKSPEDIEKFKRFVDDMNKNISMVKQNIKRLT